MWYRWNELQKNLKRDKIHCCVRIVQKARQDKLSWRQQLTLYFTKTYCHGDIFLDFFVGKLINVKGCRNCSDNPKNSEIIPISQSLLT